MRSSKQRSRSKQNRNRSVGNIVNRVFDSSGPEGKVRGTPQQIIDKYNQLARDAQLSGDRVATENFQQHAEHYTRMLAEAMREQEARREQQEQQNRERQQQNQQRQNDGQDGRRDGRQPQGGQGAQGGQTGQVDPGQAPQPDVAARDDNRGNQGKKTDRASDDVIDVSGGDSGLVDTPEMKPAPKPRTRRPRKKPEEAEQPTDQAPQQDSGDGAAEAAE